MPIDRERRMVRNRVVEIEPTEPSIGEVQLNLLTKPSLKPDAVAIPDNQHPDHELGVDRGSTDLAVKGRELLTQIGQNSRHSRTDPAQQMARRNAFFEIEEVK